MSCAGSKSQPNVSRTTVPSSSAFKVAGTPSFSAGLKKKSPTLTKKLTPGSRRTPSRSHSPRVNWRAFSFVPSSLASILSFCASASRSSLFTNSLPKVGRAVPIGAQVKPDAVRKNAAIDVSPSSPPPRIIQKASKLSSTASTAAFTEGCGVGSACALGDDAPQSRLVIARVACACVPERAIGLEDATSVLKLRRRTPSCPEYSTCTRSIAASVASWAFPVLGSPPLLAMRSPSTPCKKATGSAGLFRIRLWVNSCMSPLRSCAAAYACIACLSRASPGLI